MGPKLFAAFVAGALAATCIVYFTSLPVPPSAEAVQVSGPVIERAVAAATPPEPPREAVRQAAPAPRVTPSPTKTKRAPRAFQPVPAEQVQTPIAKVAVSASLPEAQVVAEEPALELGSAMLPPPEPQSVTLQPGTLLQVRLGERLASDRNVAGDTFVATLDQPLVVEGFVIAERGARVLGRVSDVDQAGRVKGVASISLELATLTTSDGQRVSLRTTPFVRKGEASKKSDAAKVGIGAAIGAVIGAAAGGGKGAAIGAASGAGAGTGVILATRGKAAILEAETRISFRVDQPVTITER